MLSVQLLYRIANKSTTCLHKARWKHNDKKPCLDLKLKCVWLQYWVSQLWMSDKINDSQTKHAQVSKKRKNFKEDYANHWANTVKKEKSPWEYTLKSELVFALL